MFGAFAKFASLLAIVAVVTLAVSVDSAEAGGRGNQVFVVRNGNNCGGGNQVFVSRGRGFGPSRSFSSGNFASGGNRTVFVQNSSSNGFFGIGARRSSTVFIGN